MKKREEIKRFNWLKYMKVYFLISAVVIGIGLYSSGTWGIPLGLDFTGGATVEYKINDQSQIDEIKQKLTESGIEIGQVQTSGQDRIIIKTKSLEADKQSATEKIATDLEIERIQVQNVGPTIGPELIKKTLVAIVVASIAILLWVTTQFKKVTFGISAILAMLHDSLVLIGMFSLLGKLFGAEIDFLFVTALLTTLSFSVHDTIVVFDRIREIQKKHGGELIDVANRAISETMRRSIVNSLTIIIMLVSLVAFGGDTIRWFAVALLIGAISGTYSSPFVAIPLFIQLNNLQQKIRKK